MSSAPSLCHPGQHPCCGHRSRQPLQLLGNPSLSNSPSHPGPQGMHPTSELHICPHSTHNVRPCWPKQLSSICAKYVRSPPRAGSVPSASRRDTGVASSPRRTAHNLEGGNRTQAEAGCGKSGSSPKQTNQAWEKEQSSRPAHTNLSASTGDSSCLRNHLVTIQQKLPPNWHGGHRGEEGTSGASWLGADRKWASCPWQPVSHPRVDGMGCA